MEAALPIYSVAQALRRGGAGAVRQALLGARQRTLALADAYAAALASEALRVPYDRGLNPPLWELGHIAWFQEYWVGRNAQRAQGVLCDPAHLRGPSLLASADAWYDSSHVAHPDRWVLPLPDAQATRDYLRHTFAQTLDLLDQLPEDAGHEALYFFRLVALHEEMHAEAATYMARTLGIALGPLPLVPAPALAVRGPTDVQHAAQLPVPAQVFGLGWSEPGFAFDNELGAHEVALAAFEIDAAPVSCARFRPFIEAGGYAQPAWWTPQGWQWRQQARAQPPELPQDDPHAPVLHLSAHEAEAWCRWAGRRLPEEAEWECAALTAPGFAWGGAWEWTATPFRPYPGFEPHPYRDYSAPWFETRRVLRGACAATAASLAHPRYRNFFEPHRTDIFSGFRSCALQVSGSGG